MGPNAEIAANVSTNLDLGNTTAAVAALVLNASLPAIITSGCCQQYVSALGQIVPGKYRQSAPLLRCRVHEWAHDLGVHVQGQQPTSLCLMAMPYSLRRAEMLSHLSCREV